MGGPGAELGAEFVAKSLLDVNIRILQGWVKRQVYLIDLSIQARLAELKTLITSDSLFVSFM